MNLRCFELHRYHHLGRFRELWRLFLFVCPLFYFFVAQSLRGTTSSNRSKQSISNKQSTSGKQSTSRTSITSGGQSMTSKQSTSSKQSISSKDAGKLYVWLYDGLTCDMLTRAFIEWWWSKIIVFSLDCTTVCILRIQVRASSQTKGLARGWKRERDLGETLKIRRACEVRALGVCESYATLNRFWEEKNDCIAVYVFLCVSLFLTKDIPLKC